MSAITPIPADAERFAMIQSALGTVARRAKDVELHEALGARVGQRMEGSSYGTLSRLGLVEQCTMTELAALLGLEISTVSRRVKALEDRGLVERETSPTDRRAALLRLTPEGRALFEKLSASWREMLAEVLDGWDPFSIEVFAELFARFAEALETYAVETTGARVAVAATSSTGAGTEPCTTCSSPEAWSSTARACPAASPTSPSAAGRITAIGRLAGEAATRVIDATGLVVAPGIVDAHTHYDPQITFDPCATPPRSTASPPWPPATAASPSRRCRADDHDYVAQVFARVEGMDPAALANVGWGFETFEEFLATRPGTLGVNLGMYVGHSAVRRWVMGDAAYERAATDDEIGDHGRDGHRGDGRGRRRAVVVARADPPRHGRPARCRSRLATRDELRALADAQGRPGAGQHRLRPRERGRGHRRRRPRPAHRARRAAPACPSSPRASAAAPRSTPPPRRGRSHGGSSTGRPPQGVAGLLPADDPPVRRPVHRARAAPPATRACPLWNELMGADPATKRRAAGRPRRTGPRLRAAIDEPEP